MKIEFLQKILFVAIVCFLGEGVEGMRGTRPLIKTPLLTSQQAAPKKAFVISEDDELFSSTSFPQEIFKRLIDNSASRHDCVHVNELCKNAQQTIEDLKRNIFRCASVIAEKKLSANKKKDRILQLVQSTLSEKYLWCEDQKSDTCERKLGANEQISLNVFNMKIDKQTAENILEEMQKKIGATQEAFAKAYELLFCDFEKLCKESMVAIENIMSLRQQRSKVSGSNLCALNNNIKAQQDAIRKKIKDIVRPKFLELEQRKNINKKLEEFPYFKILDERHSLSNGLFSGSSFMSKTELHIKGELDKAGNDLLDIARYYDNAKNIADIAEMEAWMFLDLPIPCTYVQRQIKTLNIWCQQIAVNQSLSICFPICGIQPPNSDVGDLALSNIDDEAITDFYIKAFGGSEAIDFSKGEKSAKKSNDAEFGYLPSNKLTQGKVHIITFDNDSAKFKEYFWKNFRVIASDKVGRTFLYRMLIEIMRILRNEGDAKYGIAEKKSLSDDYRVRRNNYRSIKVVNSNDIAFVGKDIGCILQFSDRTNKCSVLHIKDSQINTTSMEIPPDITLFHEMLHWFHCLRHLARSLEDFAVEVAHNPQSYRYLIRVYYGNFEELLAWTRLSQEEMRTILGAPNYKVEKELNLFPDDAFKKNIPSAFDSLLDIKVLYGRNKGKFLGVSGLFLEGDDLSENAYRFSRYIKTGEPIRMRFGHCGNISAVDIEQSEGDFSVLDSKFSRYRFLLAKYVAETCYNDIAHANETWIFEH